MKKMTFMIRDEYEDTDLYLFSGSELIARKRRGEPTMVKLRSCNMCGQCCLKVGNGHPFRAGDGSCSMLVEEGGRLVCKLGPMRPQQCAQSEPWDRDYCCVVWRELEDRVLED